MTAKNIRFTETAFITLLLGAFICGITTAGPEETTKSVVGKKERITPHTPKTVTIQFLSHNRDATGKDVFKTGKPGEKYSQKEDILLRFINRRDGYIYLISVNNNGVFIFFPPGPPEVFGRGVHELANEGVPQLYSLKEVRGDIFFIALYSDKLLEPKEDISPFFKDIKWLKDGNLDTESLKTRFPGSAVDYFRIFVEKSDVMKPDG